ncbi:uncharacterized protein C2845_PM02G18150 [Panicum miliaceum]|uniref:Uncharacterized protein n=1 Tax=Panicum miliaceum TaxID=4540 RepID=A0A3L6S5V8_PANMI|nr:uncharacterized protein C2845_PM02G18150 [Panicum miliaceum]
MGTMQEARPGRRQGRWHGRLRGCQLGARTGGAASSRRRGQAHGLKPWARPGSQPPGRGSYPGAPRTSCSSSSHAAVPAPPRSSRATTPPGWRLSAASRPAPLPPGTRPLPSARATLRARAERLERAAADRDELLTALLVATSRAGDSGSGGGPLLRGRDGEEERASHDARGE